MGNAGYYSGLLKDRAQGMTCAFPFLSYDYEYL